jgi:hypothetical protein
MLVTLKHAGWYRSEVWERCDAMLGSGPAGLTVWSVADLIQRAKDSMRKTLAPENAEIPPVEEPLPD